MNGQKIWEKVKRKSYKGDTLKVLFMPYKAEMWDSLWSIYEAAVLDPDTDVKVLPIPYGVKRHGRIFRIRIDKFKECEGIDEEALNKHYDIIFIHNIYDHNNLITECLYKTANLRACTDRLIYVPYFVSQKMPEVFIKQPGIKNVTDVVAEPQDVKTFKRILKEVGNNARVIRCKSPKYDYAEDPVLISPEWLRIIGRRQEVILVNVHLNGLINNQYQSAYIRSKLSQYAHDPHICVIFRPHPLASDAIRATHPEWLGEWQNLVRWVKSINNFIYDDTPDYRQAFCASTRMITDGSSLTLLYDKPMEAL